MSSPELRARFAFVLACVALTALPPAWAQTFSGLMSGSWWDATRAGEGQFITFESVGARRVAYLAYFTYTADGVATWQVGNADYAPGATSIAIPLVTGSGPQFGPGFRATDLVTASAGTAILEFVSCNRMRLRHSSIPGTALELTRLVGPLTGTNCAATAPAGAVATAFTSAMSGHWWNANRNGEGQFLTFESVGARRVAYLAYFTYDASGRATWLVGNADYAAGATRLTIPLLTGSGPRFGNAFRAADFTAIPAGSAHLDFAACSSMRLSYAGSPAFSFDVARLVGPLTGYACLDAAMRVSGPTPFAANCGAGAGTNYPNAEVEPSLAVSPVNASHVLAMWQQDRWSNGSARGLVSAVSFDGGLTWRTLAMPFSHCGGGDAGNNGDFERATDPWVSIGPDGTAWAMSLSTEGGAFASGSRNAMLVSRSRDGGTSWERPVTLITDTAPYFNDKNAMAADPFDARYAYAVWDRLLQSGGGPAMFTRTADGGATWEPARDILDPGPTGQTIGNLIVVPANGVVLNVTTVLDRVSPGSTLTARLVVLRSENRGQTWSAPFPIAENLTVGSVDPETRITIRGGALLPSAAAGPDGSIHVVWQDSRFSAGTHDAIAYSRSPDGGRTWTAPVRVNPLPAVAAFTPTVQVLPDGTLGVTYYDLRDNTADPGTLPTGYYLAQSSDGGITWTETQLAAPFDLSLAPNANGFFLGDYMGLAASRGDFLSLFVTTTGDPANRNDVFFKRVSGSGRTAFKDGSAGALPPHRWKAAAAQPFEVTTSWRQRISRAIELALDRRGRPVPR